MGTTTSIVAKNITDPLTDARVYGWDKAEFTDKVLSKGSCRTAFRGSITVSSGKLKGHAPTAGWVSVDGTQPCVVKIFHKGQVKQADAWRDDAHVLRVMRATATKFNDAFRVKGAKEILVADAVLAKVDTIDRGWFASNSFKFAKDDLVFVEPYLDGSWDKFFNNFGWFNPRRTITLEAFAHFSWAASGGQVLLCDLQGVRSKGSYLLTDPAICSQVEGACGPTDWGIKGQREFFMRHECSSLCNKLPRLCAVNPAAMRRTMDRGTSFTQVMSTDARARKEAADRVIRIIAAYRTPT
eukprot:m.72847 g.72847  ORF g.72847 m.72847 type:complete len:297 (-) comp10169_c0_seq1:61-951(-)